MGFYHCNIPVSPAGSCLFIMEMDALVDLALLVAEARKETSEEAAALLATQNSGGIVSPKLYLPVLQRVSERLPSPLVFGGFPRNPMHVKQLEAAMGPLSLAVQAGSADAAADASLHKFFGKATTPLHESPSASAADADMALDAMAAAGIVFTRTASNEEAVIVSALTNEDAAAMVLQEKS